MAESLNIGTRIDAVESMADNGIIEKYCFENNPGNCEVYGGLYLWDEMMEYDTIQDLQGICPEGWHLPTDDEFDNISNLFGGDNVAGGSLKATGTLQEGTGLWDEPNTGATNESGFTGLPAGNRSSGGFFSYRNVINFLWSSSQSSATAA